MNDTSRTAAEKFRRLKGWTLTVLAAKLGVSYPAAQKQCAGEQLPRPEAVQLWLTLSGGEVSPLDWYPVPSALLPWVLQAQARRLSVNEADALAHGILGDARRRSDAEAGIVRPSEAAE